MLFAADLIAVCSKRLDSAVRSASNCRRRTTKAVNSCCFSAGFLCEAQLNMLGVNRQHAGIDRDRSWPTRQCHARKSRT